MSMVVRTFCYSRFRRHRAETRTHVACTCHTLKNRSVLGLISSNRTSLPAFAMRRNRKEPRRPDHSTTAATAERHLQWRPSALTSADTGDVHTLTAMSDRNVAAL